MFITCTRKCPKPPNLSMISMCALNTMVSLGPPEVPGTQVLILWLLQSTVCLQRPCRLRPMTQTLSASPAQPARGADPDLLGFLLFSPLAVTFEAGLFHPPLNRGLAPVMPGATVLCRPRLQPFTVPAFSHLHVPSSCFAHVGPVT